MNKLFKLFGQIHENVNTMLNPTGGGLGLAISSTLVKLLNEDENEIINVSSKYGKGSTFNFCIKILQNQIVNNRQI